MGNDWIEASFRFSADWCLMLPPIVKTLQNYDSFFFLANYLHNYFVFSLLFQKLHHKKGRR